MISRKTMMTMMTMMMAGALPAAVALAVALEVEPRLAADTFLLGAPDGAPAGTLRQGTALQVLEERDGWLRVQRCARGPLQFWHVKCHNPGLAGNDPHQDDDCLGPGRIRRRFWIWVVRCVVGSSCCC